jgi:hypothetical protein
VSRVDLILAKLGFLALTVILPLQLGQLVWELAIGRSIPEVLLGQLPSLDALLYLPILLAIVCLTKNMIEGMGLLLVSFVLLIAAVILAANGPPQTIVGTGLGWIGSELGKWLAIGGSLVVLAALYAWRQVLVARVAALVVIGLVTAAIAYLPWDTALAVQKITTGSEPLPGLALTGDAVCVAPVRGTSGNAAAANPHANLNAKLEVTGVPAGWLLRADRVEIPKWSRNYGTLVLFSNQQAKSSEDGRLLLNAAIRVSRDKAGVPRPIPVETSLTLHEPDQVISVPLTERRTRIPGKGWCGVRARKHGRRELNCTFTEHFALEATLDDKTLACPGCGSLWAYKPYQLGVRSATFEIPKSTRAKAAEFKTYAYHSSVARSATISSQAQSDPARICPPEPTPQAFVASH